MVVLCHSATEWRGGAIRPIAEIIPGAVELKIAFRARGLSPRYSQSQKIKADSSLPAECRWHGEVWWASERPAYSYKRVATSQ